MTSKQLINRFVGTLGPGLFVIVCVPLLPVGSAYAQYTRAPIRDGGFPGGQGQTFGPTFQRHVKSWQELKRQNIVMQQRDYSCGAAALATVIRYYWGDNVTENLFLNALDSLLTVEEARDRVENGLALSDLRRVAVKTGYLASIGKLRFDQLNESKVPLVVGIIVNDYDHFVVYRGWDGEWVYLADPTRGNIRVETRTFVNQWQQNAILAVAKKNEKPKDYSPLTVRPDEMRLGALNWQVVRTFPTRLPTSFPRPFRP